MIAPRPLPGVRGQAGELDQQALLHRGHFPHQLLLTGISLHTKHIINQSTMQVQYYDLLIL